MNIIGIGIDIVDFLKIEKNFEKESFLNKFLNIVEIEKVQTFKSPKRRLEFIAGRIAAKEALLKARGTGIGTFNFNMMCIKNDSMGKPLFVSPKLENRTIFLSISHGETFAIAKVIVTEK